ncbi:hypothetical protein AC249_AIPGENE19142 [Exaiptasia diaphana]|nr:hypothetical protein AC249_AIPGENE19142 [Exaiptasia diaphana]
MPALKQSVFTYGVNIIRVLSEFTIDLLQTHPYRDGNGRLCKLLLWFLIKSLKPEKKVSFPSFEKWCRIIIPQESLSCTNPELEEWFQDQNIFTDQELGISMGSLRPVLKTSLENK